MKVLIACIYPSQKAPSQRYRIEQYLDFLQANGFDVTFSSALSKKDYDYYFSKGYFFRKAWIVAKSIVIRLREVFIASKYDVIFVHREAFMLGTSFFERQFARRSKVIYSFDDAIWIPRISEGNKAWNFLKKSSKTGEIIKHADLIFAGNNYLRNYAIKFNPNAVIIPSTIDTNLYQPKYNIHKDKICIGWSGSFSTIVHFESCINVLKIIKAKYGDGVYFKVIGIERFVNHELQIQGIPWNRDTEVSDLHAIDIGIMPLPDDEWANGKCALKGLQYMALEIPTVMSPIGVNKEIIQDGENGFLAGSEEEWVEKISKLIDSPQLRKSMGERGRKTVVDGYSVEVNSAFYLRYFKEVSMLVKK